MSESWSFVVAAYAITWAAVIGYTIYVEMKWRRVRDSVEETR